MHALVLSQTPTSFAGVWPIPNQMPLVFPARAGGGFAFVASVIPNDNYKMSGFENMKMSKSDD
jgi:hypothetical protein